MQISKNEKSKSIYSNYLGSFQYILTEWIETPLDLNLYSEIINEKIKISIISLSFRDVCLLSTMTKEERLNLDTIINCVETYVNTNWKESGGLYNLRLQRIEDEIENMIDDGVLQFDEEEVRENLKKKYNLIEEEEVEGYDYDNYDFWIDDRSRACQLRNS